MANSSYQIATTPKLYVSYPLFQYASGALDEYESFTLSNEDMIKLIQLEPSNQITYPVGSFGQTLTYKLVPSYDNFTPMVQSGLWNFDYYMILGHNFNTQNNKVSLMTADIEGQTNYTFDTTNIVNDCVLEYTGDVPEYDGWSLGSIDVNNGVNDNCRTFTMWIHGNPDLSGSLEGTKLGSILWGKSYTFPQNTQLSTSTKFEYGISQKSTISGKTISSANWTKPNNWGTEPFGLTNGEEGDNFQRRSGRRVWKMTFDSLAPDKVMPQNMMMNSNGFTAQDNHSVAADDVSSLYNINNSEDFYSAVVHKTMSGHLPMVLQIDSSDNSPSNFAIVRMNKDYTVTQKSPLLFSYSITLTEQI